VNGLPPIEGSWAGPDKIAHFLWPLAWSGWIVAFRPARYAWGPIIGVLTGLVWEVSNQFFVFEGKVGVSLYDSMSFMAGGFAAGILAALAARRKDR
jgi:hypothetical protein